MGEVKQGMLGPFEDRLAAVERELRLRMGRQADEPVRGFKKRPTTLYLTEEQYSWYNKHADATGCSFSSLIRRALDQYMEDEQ